MSVAWRPSVAEVSALLAQRVRGQSVYGLPGEQDEGRTSFDSETRPTDTQVDALIDVAVGRIRSKATVKYLCNDDVVAGVRSAAALLSAAIVEATFFPEQSTAEDSYFRSLMMLADQTFNDVLVAIDRDCMTANAFADISDDPLWPTEVDWPRGISIR